MRGVILFFLAAWLAVPALAQPATPAAMAREIEAVLRECERLGNRPFATKWPNGSPKERMEKLPDGALSYTRFYQTGGYVVRYQKKPVEKAIVYERFFANGKTSELLHKDDRVTDYTAYWEDGSKKAKYQYNSITHETFYDARDAKGRQVYPPPSKPPMP